jgi:hypothetical protein
MKTKCCTSIDHQPIAERSEKKQASPFKKIIVYAYNDGPTEGLTKCVVCGTEYKFTELARWEDIEESAFVLESLRDRNFNCYLSLSTERVVGSGIFFPMEIIPDLSRISVNDDRVILVATRNLALDISNKRFYSGRLSVPVEKLREELMI